MTQADRDRLNRRIEERIERTFLDRSMERAKAFGTDKIRIFTETSIKGLLQAVEKV